MELIFVRNGAKAFVKNPLFFLWEKSAKRGFMKSSLQHSDAHISFQSFDHVNCFIVAFSLHYYSALSVLTSLWFIWCNLKEGSLIVKRIKQLSPPPLFIPCMKETQRRKKTKMSSLSEVSTDQLGNRVVRGCGTLLPIPFSQQACGQILKDDVNGFSSTSDIFAWCCSVSLIVGNIISRACRKLFSLCWSAGEASK
jgi:hypothetical protein